MAACNVSMSLDDPLLDIVFFLGDNLLFLYAKRQDTLSHSSAEANYRGVANVVAETTWVCNLLCEMHALVLTATLFYCEISVS